MALSKLRKTVWFLRPTVDIFSRKDSVGCGQMPLGRHEFKNAIFLALESIEPNRSAGVCKRRGRDKKNAEKNKNELKTFSKKISMR